MNNEDTNLAALRPGQHLEPEELLQYVLEMLSPEDLALAEGHFGGGCEQCSRELAALRTDMGAYALASVALVDAPGASLDRLMTAVGREGGAVSASTESKDSVPEPQAAKAGGMSVLPGGKTRNGLAVAASWIGWAVAAALAIAATHYYQGRESLRGTLSAQSSQIAQLSAEQAKAREIVDALTDRSAQRVSLSLTKPLSPPQPSGRATYLANRGTLIFLASHLQPLSAGKTYELWVIPTSGKAPVPAGTFHPDAQGNANVVTAALQGTGAAKAIGITVEPDGGSVSPTMPIVMAGS